jgi:hypothetical protein
VAVAASSMVALAAAILKGREEQQLMKLMLLSELIK